MDNQFTFSGLSGIASAKVYIEPAIDFKLWGSNWAKGSITSQGYLKATGQLLPTPDCELKAGISAGAEANLKFFGANFSATSYPEIFDFSKILYTCSAPNTQLPTISTTSVTGITNNSATSGGNVTSIGASTVTAKGVCWNVSPHPTIANSSTTNGTNTGSFNSSITGLLPNTTYYVRAYATNAQGTNYGNEITFTTQPNSLTVTDIDGNVYTTVTIGTQTWMVENLKVTHYRNGDIIPNITDATQWGNLTIGGWCYYNNDVQNNNIYGKLYNWFTVSDTRNVSPTGWHIPTDADWTTLATFLGGMSIAGGKMKATTLWNSPNSGATNTSGFTGYPNGWRGITGSFNSFGTNGDWWAFGLDGTGNPLGRGLYFGDAQLYLDGGIIKQSGYAIRCIKD